MKLYEGDHARALYLARLVPAALIVLIACVALWLCGCGSPLQSAAQVANYEAAVLGEAKVYVHDDCTLPMQTLAAEPASDARTARGLALAARCDREEAALEAARIQHMALTAGIVAAHTGAGITVGELLSLTDSAGRSAIELDQVIRANHSPATEKKP